MTFNSKETSVYDGKPFELYKWSLGSLTWYQTSCDSTRTYQNIVYTPEVLSRTEVDQNGEANSGNLIVTMDIDNPIAQLFLTGPPSQTIGLIIYCGHEGETEVGCVFSGRVSFPRFHEFCELTCASRQSIWKQPIPSLTFQSQCPLRWGCTRCGVNKNDYRVYADLSYVNGFTVKSPIFDTFPDGYFRGGWIELNGNTRMVATHLGDTITLLTALSTLAVGQTVWAFPGCMGTELDCSSKFNNLANYLGFQRIPTKNPFGVGGIS